MQNPAFRAYLENKVLTASPEQLQLMLYEGAIRFALLARRALEDRDFEKAQDAFERVDAILAELLAGLRPDTNPELCERYASLYTFCCRKLNEANFRHDVNLLDDALKILHHLKDTWVLLLQKLAEERADDLPVVEESEYVEAVAIRA